MTAPVTAALPLAAATAAGYHDGLAAGLRAVFDPARPVPCSRFGYTLLPAGYAARVGRWALAGGAALADRAHWSVRPHSAAAAEGLELIQVAVTGPPDPGPAPPAGYALLLAAVRVGLTHRMLDLAVTHLATRHSDGNPLTSRQLVQAAIAGAASTIELCRDGLTAAADRPGHAGWLHARLDRADAEVTDMFGAAGYLTDHPVRCLPVVALVRNAWAAPPAHAGREEEGT